MTSAKLIPLASTRMRASPARGLGSGASLRTSVSGGPAFEIQICRIAGRSSEDRRRSAHRQGLRLQIWSGWPSAASADSWKASLGFPKPASAQCLSRRPEHGGLVDSLQLVFPPGALRKRGHRLLAHGGGYENLVSRRRALRARGD